MRSLLALFIALALLITTGLCSAQCLDFATTDASTLSAPSVGFHDGEGQAVLVANGIPWFLRTIYGGLAAIDMTNPQAPSLVEPVTFSDETFAFDIAGELACVCWLDWGGGFGIKVLDVSDPATPQVVGDLSYPFANGVAYSVAMTPGFAYAGFYSLGLGIIDLGDPSSPQIVKTVPTPGSPIGIAAAGNLVFVCDGELQIIDVQEPESAAIIGNFATTGSANFVLPVGNRAYVTDSTGLTILDISQPTSPQFLGSVVTPGNSRWVAVEGTMAYIADGYEGIQAVDISDPTDPVLRGALDFTPPGGGSLNSLAMWQGQVLAVENHLRVLPPQCELVSATPGPTPVARALRAVPNPFNPRTRIEFELARESLVSLEVFDTRGRKIRSLLSSEFRPAGPQAIMWDGNNGGGEAASSGVYFYRLLTDDGPLTGRMALLR